MNNETWFGPLFVLGAMGIALALLLAWERRWSRRLSRAHRLRIGCLGSAGALLTLIVGAGVSSGIGRPACRDAVFAVTGLFAGVGWLFFGNVLMGAIWPRKNK